LNLDNDEFKDQLEEVDKEKDDMFERIATLENR